MRLALATCAALILALPLAGCSSSGDDHPASPTTSSSHASSGTTQAGGSSLTEQRLVSALPWKAHRPKSFQVDQQCIGADSSCGRLPYGHGNFVALTPPNPVFYQGEGEHLLAATIHWNHDQAAQARRSALHDMQVFRGSFEVGDNQLTTAGYKGTGAIGDFTVDGWKGWEVRTFGQSTHSIGQAAPFSVVRVFVSKGDYTAQVDFRRWRSRAKVSQVATTAENTLAAMVKRLNGESA